MVSKLTSETEKSETSQHTSPPAGPALRARAPFERSCQTAMTPLQIPGVPQSYLSALSRLFKHTPIFFQIKFKSHFKNQIWTLAI